MLENKLGITTSPELAKEEERISKKKAVEMYDSGMLDKLNAGRFSALREIHKYLFDEIYDFVEEIREVNIAKGNFRFAPLTYLEAALENIDKMPQSTFDEIVEKYVEMNIAHPFREGNGRSGRLLLNLELIRNGYPAINVKFTDRRRYYDAFDAYYGDGDHMAMVDLVAEYVSERYEDYFRVVEN